MKLEGSCLQNKQLFRYAMAAGIFTANITVTATGAAYLHDCDGNMFAMLDDLLTVKIG
jgi:hypothetical protein